MRSKPYEAQHLRDARVELDTRARNVQEILRKDEKSHKKKGGLLAKILGWFS